MEVLNNDAKASDWAKEVAEAAPPEPEKPAEAEAEAEPLVTVAELTAPEKPAEAAKPEARPEPSEAEQPRMVPLQALHAERQQRRAIEQRMAEIESYVAQQEAPPEYDPNVQPIEALEQTRQELHQLREERRQELAERQNQADTMHMAGAYAQAAKQFAKETADFPYAYKHVIETRKQELAELGYDDYAIVDTLRNEELGLVSNAMNNGLNPAQVIYRMAKARGYAAKPPAPAAAAKIEMQQAKQAAATSISPGGKPPKPEFSAADLASLNGAEFDSAWNKMESIARGKTASMFRR